MGPLSDHAPEQVMRKRSAKNRPMPVRVNGAAPELSDRSEHPDPDQPLEPVPSPDDPAQRRLRRRQTVAAIAAILAIVIFALIQGFLGAPSKIPGTH